MRKITGLLKVERRVAARYPIRHCVLYVVGGCVLEAQTVDISLQGMCLQTGMDLEIGSELTLFLEPRDHSDKTRLQARVQWVRREPASGEEVFHWGLRFEAMPKDVAARLNELIGGHAPEVGEEELPEAHPADVVEVEAPPLSPPPSVGLEDAFALDKTQRQHDVRHADSFLRRGVAAAARGDLTMAVTFLEQALEQMPDSEEAIEELARVVYLQGDIVRSVALFDRALRVRQEKR